MRFSDLPLFFIDSTKYEFVAVFQNSYRSQKRLLATPGPVFVKFVSIATVTVCVCPFPPF